MRSKKILFILIPLIIVVLALGGGFAFLMLNSTPEKIFKTSINRVFDVLKNEEEKITTLSGKMTLSGSIDSDDEEVQAINDILEISSVTLNMDVDTEKMIVNENIDVTYEDESILDATILLQDEKGYVYLPEFLDKYLEIPEEELDFSELEEMINNTKTLDRNLLVSVIQTEILNIISKQELIQEKTILNLDGNQKNVTASILSLKDEEIIFFVKEFLGSLKNNENFQKSLGEYNKEIIEQIEEIEEVLKRNDDTDKKMEELLEEHDLLNEVKKIEKHEELKISIYTEGIFNKFVGISLKTIQEQIREDEENKSTSMEMSFIKINNQKYEFVINDEYAGTTNEMVKIIIEDKKENKNKGTATITISAEEEEYVIVYNYENKENQTNFKATTEIDGVMFEVTGNNIKDGNSIAGKLGLSFEQEELTINVNADYDFAYNVEIQKTNIDESVLIDELTEQDQEEIMTNLEGSKLYEITMALDNGLFERAQLAAQATQDALKKEEQLFLNVPTISSYGYTLMYMLPESFELSSDATSFNKIYTDNGYNLVSLTIEASNIVKYLKDIENSSILTSKVHENQELGEITDYEANGKKYKYRTITYTINETSYVNLYFAYELEDGYTYIVKVESEGGQVALEDINKFLDITVQKDSINSMMDDAEMFMNNSQV